MLNSIYHMVLKLLNGSIPLTFHKVWPRLFWGEAYRWKKIPVDPFIGHIPLLYKKLIKYQIYYIKIKSV